MAKDRAQDLNELLTAYLDGELDETGRAEVVAHLERDADAVKLLSALRQTRAMLQDLPRETAPDDFVDDVVAAVERQALLGRPGDQPAVRSIWRRWGPIRSAAAVVLLVGAAGSWVFWQIDQSAGPRIASNGAPARSTFDERVPEEAATSAASGLAKLDDAEGDKTLLGDRDAGLELASAAKHSAAASGTPAAVGMEPTPPAGTVAEVRADLFADAESGLAGEFDEDQVVSLDSDWTADTPDDKVTYFDLGLARRLRPPPANGASTVSLAQQLMEGQSVEALVDYPFANESNALTFEFGSDAERERFVVGIDTYLAANSFLDVADTLQRRQVTQPDLQNVYLRGHAGVNYSELGSEQMLISAPAEVLEGLIDRYALTAGAALDKNSVQLQIGDVQVQGVEQARTAAQAIAMPQLRDRVLKSDGETNNQAGIVTYARADERSTQEWEYYYVQLGSVRRAQLAEVVSDDKEAPAVPADGLLAERAEHAGAGFRRSETLGTAADHPRRFTAEVREETPAATADGEEPGAVDAERGDAERKTRRRAPRKGTGRGAEGAAPGTRRGGAGDPQAMAKKAAEIESPASKNLEQLRQLDGPAPAARGRRRAGNLTFILKLQVAPPLELEGPPAPDDVERSSDPSRRAGTGCRDSNF